MIDLRSDTVTKPTPAMYEAMVTAELGDDMAGEDPTANRLEAFVAELLGKEAALLCTSGTQSNQIGLRCHCQPGDELLIHETGHVANFEGGAPAAMSGISCRLLPGERGMLDVATLEAAWRPQGQHHPRTRLLSLENSTNIGGGAAWPLDRFIEVCDWAREKGLKVHLDGARLFNAAVAREYHVRDIAELVDTVSICFSKGLGCPFGSILVGSSDDIAKARRARKLFGGALRQAGVIAGAALYALEHHVDRLTEDHENARLFAERIAECEVICVRPVEIETNIVFFEVDPAWGTAAEFSQKLAERGVRINPVGRQRLRALTHLDVNRDDVLAAAGAIAEVAQARAAVTIG
ncbi:MAG: aminotransferase class V-fold PLP-dependent enzyme [Planctomycetaceae bacterium]|nr:aminotransferase class V-fold PLP-dependent enzyme [Planctomycetaceae bacterium]